MYSYHKDNRDFLIYFIFYAAFLHTYMAILPSNEKTYRIIYKADIYISFNMAKKKNQKKRDVLSKKRAVETLRFQTHWGLKQLGHAEGSMLHQRVNTEIDLIAELELAQDLLTLKLFIDDVKKNLATTPTPEKGDLVKSPTAIALGIASVGNIEAMETPLIWKDMVDQKLLSIYYPGENRNDIVDWAKVNGYNTSTYLGRPILKLSKLFVMIERTRE